MLQPRRICAAQQRSGEVRAGGQRTTRASGRASAGKPSPRHFYSLWSHKNVAVVLSGCGVYDGSEIHESVSVLQHVSRLGSVARCFAPNIPQAHVVNHLTGQIKQGESRNVLEEAARIARGAIQPLNLLKADEFDAVIFPGGFGAAKNLCTFASDGANMTVESEVERVVKEFHAARKPIGLCCIAPVIGARVISNATVTLGKSDDPAAVAVTQFGNGGKVESQPIGGVCLDKLNLLVSTPAYMYSTASIHGVYTGVGNMVEQVLLLCKQN